MTTRRFYRSRELADKAGITVPITAGIMPFMGKSQISRMGFMRCVAALPRHQILAKYENDPESLQAAGVDYAARQLCDLREQRRRRSAPVHYESSYDRRDHYGAPGVMEKPHIDTTAVEVPADLASPALYRVDAAHHPRVDRAEMLRYLGYGGQQIEPELSQRIELVVERLELDIEPRGVRRVFAVDATGVDQQGEPCIRLVGTNVELRGRDIYRHLKDARFAALMACTLGTDAERRLRTTGASSP